MRKEFHKLDKRQMAFIRKKVKELTGDSRFEHWIVCTKFCDRENERLWTRNKEFRKNLTPYLRIISLDTIFYETQQ